MGEVILDYFSCITEMNKIGTCVDLLEASILTFTFHLGINKYGVMEDKKETCENGGN